MLIDRRYGLAAIGVAAVLGLSACGDDKETVREGATETSPSKPAPTGAPDATVEVELAPEFKLRPTNGRAEKAGVVEFKLENTDEQVHSLEVERPGFERASQDIQPGSSGSFKADLPAGEYKWYCPVPGHEDLGMKGKLTVG
jgi:plastocyanin